MTYKTSTTSSEATQALAVKLAKLLRGGETIELSSDLGGGKTTFVQGLARGLLYSGRVSSPTFTLSNIYQAESGIEVHHYDLYRLAESGIVGEELAEDMADDAIITIIEWAGVAGEQLPPDRLIISFTVTGECDRNIQVTSGGPRSLQLLTGLQQ